MILPNIDTDDDNKFWLKRSISVNPLVKFEIDLDLLQKGKTRKRVWVKPTATKKGYYREQEVGVEEKKPPRKDTGKIASLPEDMKKEILDLRRLGDSGASIKSQIENMIDASDDPKIKDNLAAKGILKSSSGPASLNVTGQSLVDWSRARGVESKKKRKTVKVVEEEAKEIEEKRFKEANEKLARLQTENKMLQEQLGRERKSKMESDSIRDKLRNENYILREKLKSVNLKKSVGSGRIIEIDLSKVERGLREEKVKVIRGGKTFYRRQRVGQKEKEKGVDLASQLKVGDKIKFMGEEKEVTHIFDVTGSFELDNKLSYTPKEINKYGESIKGEPKKPPVIMGLNKPEIEEEKPEPKVEEKIKPDSKIGEEEYKPGGFLLFEDKNAENEMQKYIKTKEFKKDKGTQKAINAYTITHYVPINTYLRENDLLGTDKDEIEDYINKFSDFLDSAPKVGGKFYRGMNFYKEDKDGMEDMKKFINSVEKSGIGGKIELPGFTSTTPDRDTAEFFAESGKKRSHSVVIEIQTKNGVYLNGLSPISSEVTINKGSKFKIVSFDKSDLDNIILKLEEI